MLYGALTDRLVVKGVQPKNPRWQPSRSTRLNAVTHPIMTKTLDIITEVIRDPKHPFRQVADRPDKPHKNRYERRKVKQFIQQGDWQTQEES